jgi:hypothetical protein
MRAQWVGMRISNCLLVLVFTAACGAADGGSDGLGEPEVGLSASQVDGGVPAPQIDGGGNPCWTAYRDSDGDGYGEPNTGIVICQYTPGYVRNQVDCDDQNPKVHPFQTQYFTTPRANGSFDYDCDGEGLIEYYLRASCGKGGLGGSGCQSGWMMKVPLCGESWEWVECARNTQGVCVETAQYSAPQACH